MTLKLRLRLGDPRTKAELGVGKIEATLVANKDNGSPRKVDEPGVAAGLGDPSIATGSEVRSGAMGKMGTSRGGKARELVGIRDSNQTKGEQAPCPPNL